MMMRPALLLSSPLVIAAVAVVAVAALLLAPPAAAARVVFEQGNTPTSANCTEKYITQNIDHFNWAPPRNDSAVTTFSQRYFICDQYYDKNNPNVTFFFYFGNEDDVTLYVNHTGLMWENAKDFNAILLFGEHRYYGVSQPYPKGTPGCMSWLTSEQAMADDAHLIETVKAQYGLQNAPVIGFGGSYGGMLGTYFKRHYPTVVNGLIAASAPIWSFSDLSPPYNYYAFNNIIADDASSPGGCSDYCKSNYISVQERLLVLMRTHAGRVFVQEALHLCDPLTSAEQAYDVIAWTQNAWSYMAMGNYPYPSGYIIHNKGLLPAYPVRVACEELGKKGIAGNDDKLFKALYAAMDVFYNYTHTEPCFPLVDSTTAVVSAAKMGHNTHHMLQTRPADMDALCTGDWGYQFCTEMVMPSSQGGPKDMFLPPMAWNLTETTKGCVRQWNVAPREGWSALALASKDLSQLNNVVLSNGGLDPWRAGGVTMNISDRVHAVVIESGAHHLDLMFSTPDDPQDVIDARTFELAHMRKWASEHWGS